MKMEELQPYNGRKSFYGKAQIVEDDESVKLFSYGTLVAEITDTLHIYNLQSNTTRCHVKSFAHKYCYEEEYEQLKKEFKQSRR